MSMATDTDKGIVESFGFQWSVLIVDLRSDDEIGLILEEQDLVLIDDSLNESGSVFARVNL
jgi:hypothetical protein